MRLILLAFLFAPTLALAQQPLPCSTEAYRHLDFWTGTWDLTWPGGAAQQRDSAPRHT